MNEKKQLRKQILSLRDSLSIEERKSLSRDICNQLLPYLENKNILSYSPTASEADLSFINENCDVAYPHILSRGIMEALKPVNHSFITNTYGIKEPEPHSSLPVDKTDLDIILVPCVAFDEKKYRLGHGGGYYDRYLKDFHGLKIGIAYELQKVKEVPTEEHDVPLDLIITEKKIYK